ncbi:vacuolar protein sorting-associated protein 13C-like [Ostrinia furnacalis]|uniref:vacuolar protein sorting-associated protein 13C-like n=1 Tax=Ostrinia furnacalis TaxID=93504 RepID=UPI00103F846F|nr:vacuolar protein sorting-associated protein 13C-like [Ostrinia furnacalis]
MFEGAVAGILNRLLGKYVQDLDTENLNVGIFSGNVNLTDLKLKPEALYELDLPIDVKIGTIGRINLQIPWSGLYTQPVVVHIEDVLVLVGPAISNSYFDPEREKRLTRAAKRKILQDLEAESEILKGPQNFFENLFTAIVNNLQIYVRNVHVRYEDSISSKDGPLACGLCLQSLSIETTNSKWKPSVTPVDATTVYQMMRVESLSLYWNPTATALDDNETAHITPMQYYNWKHYMLTGLDKFSMHHEDFEFLLKPVTCKVKVLINRSGEARVPRLLLDAVLQDSALQLSRRQFLSVDNLLASFARIKLNRKYRHFHPGVPLYKDVKKWWKYAYNVVVEQRVRPYSWAAIKKHRENYNVYKKTYKSTLRSPNDTELKLDLQKCEDSLPIISVVIAREHAKFELLSQEPETIEVVESEYDWWKPTSPSSETEPEPEKPHSRVELCVKRGRCRSPWGQLSSNERARVCELIGYVEGAPSKDSSKQCIEHKLNLTLANCSLTLMNRSKEVMVVTLTQFLASLETRPSAKAYKLSARTESIVIEGASSDGELVPLLTPERGAGAGANLLAVDFERNPVNSDADYGLTVLLEPVELLYVEHAFTELINLFQTRPMSRHSLSAAMTSAATRAARVSRAALVHAVSRRQLFHVSVSVRAPCVLLPEHARPGRSGRLLVLDISRIVIKSDLQPPNLALEDATCMELEERLYDRLHAECECQVLFCEWDDPWREQRKHADSELHLVPKIKMQVVFSNSIKKDYKLLPRYKLNISLSSLKFNLSDRIIGLLLDFADNLPMPVPNTVPVSFLDSGDYAEDLDDPELAELFELDTVTGDPEYPDLVKLRQKIVAAYLRSSRAGESCMDRDGARLGFQAAAPAFLSAEHSDEDMELYARSVDLPGFDDNVSPSNHINVLLRFVVGEIVINLSRSTEQVDRPYVMLSVSKACVDVALMAYGPAVQLAARQLLLADKLHRSASGQYLELLTSDGELFNLLYRKVRADCPEFRSHFHSVEQSLVVDVGALSVLLHAPALHTLVKYLQYVGDKIQNRRALNIKKVVAPRAQTLWDYIMKPEADPPVPPGATKFSYSVRATSLSLRLWQLDSALLELRLIALESDCVFRANDRCVFRLYLSSLHLDDLSEATLYPKLVWPDEDKVLEIKYVRAAPRLYGDAQLKAHGELRVHVGRVHVVLFHCVLMQLQQFLEPLIPAAAAGQAAAAAEKAAARARPLRSTAARLNLVIQIHAPVLLLPQKPSSPNLLVLNMGDLSIENFFKLVNPGQDASSPVQSPIIDNILIKLVNVTLSRAVMTLAGTLEVQEPILEPVCARCDMKRLVAGGAGAAREHPALEADVIVDSVLLNVGQRDLATLLAVWADNLSEAHYIGNIVPTSPVEVAPSDASVKKLQAFLAQGEPIRKEAVFRFTLEGVELKLFSDMDEVLSSPVRDLNHGLAKLTAGEATVQLDYYSDSSTEMKASLQSLLIEDIRPDPTIVIKRIFQCQGGATRASGGISVRRPPLIDCSVRVGAARAAQVDVRVDRTRLNLAPPFLLQLAKTLLDAVPGTRGLVSQDTEPIVACGDRTASTGRRPSCCSWPRLCWTPCQVLAALCHRTQSPLSPAGTARPRPGAALPAAAGQDSAGRRARYSRPCVTGHRAHCRLRGPHGLDRAPPFLLQLAKTLLDAVPGTRGLVSQDTEPIVACGDRTASTGRRPSCCSWPRLCWTPCQVLAALCHRTQSPLSPAGTARPRPGAALPAAAGQDSAGRRARYSRPCVTGHRAHCRLRGPHGLDRAPPFLLQLAKTLLDAVPGTRGLVSQDTEPIVACGDRTASTGRRPSCCSWPRLCWTPCQVLAALCHRTQSPLSPAGTARPRPGAALPAAAGQDSAGRRARYSRPCVTGHRAHCRLRGPHGLDRAPPFLLQLAKTLLDAVPGTRGLVSQDTEPIVACDCTRGNLAPFILQIDRTKLN